MVDVNGEGEVGAKRDASLRAAFAGHCVMVTMKFLELTWPRSREWLVSVVELDLGVIESVLGVLPFSPDVIESMRRVAVRRIELGTRYSPACALATVVCACTISWTRLDVVGWFPYDFTTENLYVVPRGV